MCLSLKLWNLFGEIKYLVHSKVVSRSKISDSIVFTACYSFVSKRNLVFNALLSNADDSVHSLLFMWEGHIRDVFWVSVVLLFFFLSSDSQSGGLCGVRNRANQPWMKTSTCRTAHTWKNMMRGSWLGVSLFSHVGKAIGDIWLVYIGLRPKIYSVAFQCVNLSMYIMKYHTTLY